MCHIFEMPKLPLTPTINKRASPSLLFTPFSYQIAILLLHLHLQNPIAIITIFLPQKPRPSPPKPTPTPSLPKAEPLFLKKI